MKACRVLLLSSLLTLNALGADDPWINGAKNIARLNCGAEIECFTPDGQSARVSLEGKNSAAAGILIMEDDSISCPLSEGDTTFVVSLPRSSPLDRLTLRNENAAARGTLQLAVANHRLPPQSSEWTPVEGAVAFSHKRLFQLSLLGVEARYVRLSFHVEHEGRIASLGIYGQRTLDDFAGNEARLLRKGTASHSSLLADTINFNFANGYASARIVYVSSGRGGLAARMIDDDPLTGFHFSSSDPHPTVIVELADAARINRVSAVYKMQASRLEVFLLDNLPQIPGDLSGLKPVATMEDGKGEGKAALQFDPHGARYVALRWSPDKAENFDVAEIEAFGDVPLTRLAAANLGAPSLFARNNSRRFFGQNAGEIGSDFALTPPVIPVVSR